MDHNLRTIIQPKRNVEVVFNLIDSADLENLLYIADNVDEGFLKNGTDPKGIELISRQHKLKITRQKNHCQKQIVLFNSIIQKFVTFDAHFDEEVMENRVKEYFKEFKRLLVPGISIQSATAFMANYQKLIKGVKHTEELIASQKIRDHDRNVKVDSSHLTERLRKNEMERNELEELKRTTWKKWKEMCSWMGDGIQLIRALETWKKEVATRLSEKPSVIFRRQMLPPNNGSYESRLAVKNLILETIRSLKFDWDAFTIQSTLTTPNRLLATHSLTPSLGEEDSRSSSVRVMSLPSTPSTIDAHDVQRSFGTSSRISCSVLNSNLAPHFISQHSDAQDVQERIRIPSQISIPSPNSVLSPNHIPATHFIPQISSGFPIDKWITHQVANPALLHQTLQANVLALAQIPNNILAAFSSGLRPNIERFAPYHVPIDHSHFSRVSNSSMEMPSTIAFAQSPFQELSQNLPNSYGLTPGGHHLPRDDEQPGVENEKNELDSSDDEIINVVD